MRTLVSLSLLSICLARPQWGAEPASTDAKPAVLWIFVDVSRSMSARDATPDRLTFAKRLATSAAADWPGYTAVAAFAGECTVVCPPTSNRPAVARALAELSSDSTPSAGSDLWAPVDFLHRRKLADEGTVALAISDGGTGEPRGDAHSTARIAWHFVGVGDPSADSYIPIQVGAETDWLKHAGRLVATRCNEAALRGAAQKLGGTFLRATGRPNDVVASLQAGLSTSSPSDGAARTPIERYRWFLIPALLAAAFAGWRWPRAAAVLLSLAVPQTAFAADGDPAAEFRQGMTALARQEFAAASEAFDRGAHRTDELGWRARWGRANARAEIARRLPSSAERTRELFAALASYRALQRESFAAAHAADLDHNVNAIKNWLAAEPPETRKNRAKEARPVNSKEASSTDDRPPTQANETGDDKSPAPTKSEQPGPVQTPERGMATADPGKLSKEAAAALIEKAQQSAKQKSVPTRKRASDDY